MPLVQRSTSAPITFQSLEPLKNTSELSPASPLEKGHSIVHATHELVAPPEAPMNLEAKEVQSQESVVRSTGNPPDIDMTSRSPHLPAADPAVTVAPHAESVESGKDQDPDAAAVDQNAVVGAPEKEDEGVLPATPPGQGIDTHAGRKAVKTPRRSDGNSGGGAGLEKGGKDGVANVAKGEWVCAECLNVNWSFRMMCNRCRAPTRGQHAGSPQESTAASSTQRSAATPARGTPHSAATRVRGTPHSLS